MLEIFSVFSSEILNIKMITATMLSFVASFNVYHPKLMFSSLSIMEKTDC